MNARRTPPRADDAVSPVIAVILMVAITIVLAMMVFVWVSGFGSSSAAKRFPQVLAEDDRFSTAPFSSSHSIVVLDHRGGDTIEWSRYDVKVFREGVLVAPGSANLQFSTSALVGETCGAPLTTAPTAAFSVGARVRICEGTAAAWSADDEVKIQILDLDQNLIVYELALVIS